MLKGSKSYSPWSNAQKTEVDGIVFKSKAESLLYKLLKEGHAQIYCEPKVYLTLAKILYKPDFFCDGIYHEMKGREWVTWRLKRRLWLHYGPGELRVYKMKGQTPVITEILIPERAVGGESYKPWEIYRS